MAGLDSFWCVPFPPRLKSRQDRPEHKTEGNACSQMAEHHVVPNRVLC